MKLGTTTIDSQGESIKNIEILIISLDVLYFMFSEPSEEFKYGSLLDLDNLGFSYEKSYDEMKRTILGNYEKPLIWRFTNTSQKDNNFEVVGNKKFDDSFFMVYDCNGYICLDVGYIYEYGHFYRNYDRNGYCTRCIFEGNDDFAYRFRKREHITGKNKLESLYHKLKQLNNDHLSKIIIFEESSNSNCESFDSIKIDNKEIFYKFLCYKDNREIRHSDDDEIKFTDDEVKELFIKEFYKMN